MTNDTALDHKPPEPPAHLSDEARRWWADIALAYCIEDEAGQLLLATALEAFDRMRGAQSEIARDGATVLDRFDVPHDRYDAWDPDSE